MSMSNLRLVWVAGAALAIGGACAGEEIGVDKRANASTESRTAAESEGERDASSRDEEGSQQSRDSAGAEAGAESSSELPLTAEGPVAKIDGQTIGAEEFNAVVRRRFGNTRRPVPEPMAEKLKTQILSALVEQHLLKREIERSEIAVSEDEIDEEMKKFSEKFPNERARKQFLEGRGLTESDLRENLRRDAKLRKLLRRERGVEVTEEEARTHYDENIEAFREPEKVKARHILVEVGEQGDRQAAKSQARELVERARKGETSFADLAREHSDGPSAKKGGDLGYFARDRMVEAFAEEVFSMEDGEISGPVETKFGFHVIKREDSREANTESFESAKSKIVSKLEREKFRKATDEYISDLRGEAEIEEKPGNIRVTTEGRERRPATDNQQLENLKREGQPGGSAGEE